jgi:hypothetical protein
MDSGDQISGNEIDIQVPILSIENQEKDTSNCVTCHDVPEDEMNQKEELNAKMDDTKVT